MQRILEFQHEVTFFSLTERFGVFYERFLDGGLGKFYYAILWEDLVVSFGLGKAAKGSRFIFSLEGRLDLLVLMNLDIRIAAGFIKQIKAIYQRGGGAKRITLSRKNK